MKHRKIRQLFYDYLRGDLEPSDRKRVEEHLSSCSQCAREFEEHKTVFEALPSHVPDASKERDDEFWNTFPIRVEELIRQRRIRRSEAQPLLLDTFISKLMHQPRWVVAVGSTVALGAVALLAWQLRSPISSDPQQSQILQPIIERSPDQLGQYLRRSKALLVGMMNLRSPEDQPVDLSVEHRASVQLLRDVREIPRDSLDRYSAQVVEDLERVLSEISMLESQERRRGEIEPVLESIRQQNLLFKIRMAEAMREQSGVVNASNRIH